MGGFVLRTPRERLLAVVAEVVSTRGYEHTTLDDVAAAAGLGVDEVVALVGDLDACVLEAAVLSNTIAFNRALAVFQAAESWPDAIYDATLAVVDIIVSEPAFVRLNILEMPKIGPTGVARMLAWREAFTAFLTEGAEGAGERAEANAPRIAELIAGGVFHVLVTHAIDDRLDRIGEAVPDVVRAILRPYCDDAEIDALIRARRCRTGR